MDADQQLPFDEYAPECSRCGLTRYAVDPKDGAIRDWRDGTWTHIRCLTDEDRTRSYWRFQRGPISDRVRTVPG